MWRCLAGTRVNSTGDTVRDTSNSVVVPVAGRLYSTVNGHLILMHACYRNSLKARKCVSPYHPGSLDLDGKWSAAARRFCKGHQLLYVMGKLYK